MLGRDRDTTSDGHHTADGFAAFFARKIEEVRTSTAGHPTPVGHVLGCTCRMSSFRPRSQAEIRRTVMKSPVKSSRARSTRYQHSCCVNLSTCYCRSLRAWSMRHSVRVDYQSHSVTPLSFRSSRSQDLTQLTWVTSDRFRMSLYVKDSGESCGSAVT